MRWYDRVINRIVARPPRLFRLLVPQGLYRQPSAPGERPCVYLTFDDGPHPEVTPRVLEMLSDRGIRATFFMVGHNVERYPATAAAVRRAGHAVGNHTYDHLQGVKVTLERYLEDVERCRRLVSSELMRPPHGWLRPSQAKALAARYRIVMYDVVTRDYSRLLDAQSVVDNVRRYVTDGSIIVFHDSLKSWPRLERALPEALDYLTAAGYEFKTL